MELANASCIMFSFPIGVAIASKVGPVVDKSVREDQFIRSVVEPIQCGRVEHKGQLHPMACSGEVYRTCTVTQQLVAQHEKHTVPHMQGLGCTTTQQYTVGTTHCF